MPRMADGSIVRARYTKLALGELSAVDRPAQPGATMAIMKRDASGDDLQEVAKYVCEGDGAHSFIQVLHENEFSQKIWPFTDALTQSIRSIVGDKRLSGDEREVRITESVTSFLQKVREISPEVAKQLEGLVSKKDGTMPKSIEELTKELEATTSKLATATAEITTLTTRATKAEGELETAKAAVAKAESERDAAKAEGGELATVKAELATTKAALAAATDETISVGGNEVKKSEIGDAQFKVMKGLADERDLARLEKRADTEFRHVVGKAEDKAKVLKFVEGIGDEPTRKAFEAILTSAEKMAARGFDMVGGNGGLPPSEEEATAKRDFDAAVAKNVEGGMKQTEAMRKARTENPDLFAKAYPEQAGQQ